MFYHLLQRWIKPCGIEKKIKALANFEKSNYKEIKKNTQIYAKMTKDHKVKYEWIGPTFQTKVKWSIQLNSKIYIWSISNGPGPLDHYAKTNRNHLIIIDY